jgi:cysteine-S-conjugate beta-lyase
MHAPKNSLSQRSTLCIHAPDAPGGFAALTPPIHRASTVVFDTPAAFRGRSARLYDGYAYGLYGTPTTRALEDQIALLEGGVRALLLPSGLAAIAVATIASVDAGDVILLPEGFYGPARAMIEQLLSRFGVAARRYHGDATDELARAIDPRPRVLWIESPGSTTFEVRDVARMAREASARGIRVAMDNTWATPLGFQPLRQGADISMQSLSKYAGGHSDVLMGSLAFADEDIYRRAKDVARLLGYGVSGEDCFLVSRGLATMPLRLAQSAESAATLMARLETRAEIAQILHPSRPGHPGQDVFARDYTAGAGLFGIVLKREFDAAAVDTAFAALEIFKIGASWGGAHSLIAPSDPKSERADLEWLPDGPYLRVAVGLEDAGDLAVDLFRFLDALSRAPGKSAA